MSTADAARAAAGAGEPEGSPTVEPYRDPQRQAALQSRRRRDVTLATISTVVFAVVVVLGVGSTPGWPATQRAFFSGHELVRSFPAVIASFWVNVQVFLLAEVAILVLALLVALVRRTTAPVLLPIRVVAIAYTDLLRGIPTLLLVYLAAFGIPALEVNGLPTSPLLWGSVALVVSYSAYVSEVFRSGIESVHRSQWAGARALGLSYTQTLSSVVLPQAVRNVLPPLLNDFVALQKDTALLSVVGPIEVFRQAQIWQTQDFNFTPLVGAAIIFIVITVPQARLIDHYFYRQVRSEAAS